MRNLLLVGTGSFIGGICRFLCQQIIQKNYPASIPLGTLGVNVAGCFIIGLIYGLTGKTYILSPELRLFMATGFCGGFTTFSAFAYENISLIQNAQFLYAATYILLSLFAGFAAVYAGILFIKFI